MAAISSDFIGLSPKPLSADAGQEPLPVDDPIVEQGKLEGSIVAGIVEMTKMMRVVRSYQSAANMANQEHERQRRAIEALAGVRR